MSILHWQGDGAGTVLLMIQRHAAWITSCLLLLGCGTKPTKSEAITATPPAVASETEPPTTEPAARPPGLLAGVDGKLVGVGGAPVQLASTWVAKPTIVVFYRGFF
jgi:hypothetical protein